MDEKSCRLVAAILFWFFGAVNLLGAVLTSRVPQALAGMSAGEAAVPLLLSGALFIIAGFGLWLGKSWGRTLAIVVLVLSLLSTVISFATDFFSGALDGSGKTRWYWVVDFITLVCYAVMLWLVVRHKPKRRRR